MPLGDEREVPGRRRIRGTWSADNQPVGVGILISAAGDPFVTKWTWHADGTGIRVVDMGQKYWGQMINGIPHGTGKMIWPDGQRYEGDWQGGQKDGTGTWTLASGDVYSGQLAEDQPHGEGKWVYADGAVFTGRFAKVSACVTFRFVSFPFPHHNSLA